MGKFYKVLLGCGTVLTVSEKNINDYKTEKLNNEFSISFKNLGGLQYHRVILEEFINFTKRASSKTKLIFITQTKSICDLRNFPKKIRYRENIKENVSLKKIKLFEYGDWLTVKGICYRLGIIKSNLNFLSKNFNDLINFFELPFLI